MRKVGEEHPPFVVFNPLIAAVCPHALELLHLQVARRPPAPRRGVPARHRINRALLNRLKSAEPMVLGSASSHRTPRLSHISPTSTKSDQLSSPVRVVHAVTYPGNLPRSSTIRPSRSTWTRRTRRRSTGRPGPRAAVAGLVGVGDVGVGVELFVVVHEGRRRFARHRRVVAVASGTAELNHRGRAIVARRIVIDEPSLSRTSGRDVVVVVVCGGRIVHPHLVALVDLLCPPGTPLSSCYG